LIALSKAGSIVVGFNAAVIGGGVWLRDERSWSEMWEDVGNKPGTKWHAKHVVVRKFLELGNAPPLLTNMSHKYRIMCLVSRVI
jgi:hypothetical protein